MDTSRVVEIYEVVERDGKRAIKWSCVLKKVSESSTSSE